MKKETISFRIGELFSGPGGIGLASKLAKIETEQRIYEYEHVWATDYDKDSCETYKNNIMPHHKSSVVCEDIRKLDFGRLNNISGIDCLAFGFPCNDFSVVGEQKGINGTFGPLYMYGINALEFFKPMCFLAENVNGLKNANDGKTFRIILEKLDAAGYVIVPHLYKFEKYGVPQARHRIIIVGIRKDQNCIYKVPSTRPYDLIDNSARTALECPPISSCASNHELTRQALQVVERLKYIRPGENAFTAIMPSHLQLNVAGATISQIYRRLRPDKPAYTITGSGGGGTHVYHWAENRALTNRERARLQTFPDDFVFSGSKESVRRQVGMAVPPAGVRIILESLLKTFAGIEYDSIEQNLEFTGYCEEALSNAN